MYADIDCVNENKSLFSSLNVVKCRSSVFISAFPHFECIFNISRHFFKPELQALHHPSKRPSLALSTDMVRPEPSVLSSSAAV